MLRMAFLPQTIQFHALNKLLFFSTKTYSKGRNVP